MRISLDQKIAGYPAIRIRELMRQTAGGPIMFRHVRRILQCSHIAAARVMKHLEKRWLNHFGGRQHRALYERERTSNGNRGPTPTTRNSNAFAR